MKKYISVILCILLSVQLVSFPVFAQESTAETLSFPEVSAEMIKTEMTKTIAKGHPYLFVTDEKLAKIKEYAFGKDETYTQIYQAVKRKADKLLETDINRITVDISNDSYIGTGVASWNETMILGLAYLIEGDERYAQRAYEQSEYFCGLSDWGTKQLIDNVQTVFCVALCYDWLYDWLGDEQKQVLITGLNEKHMNMMSDLCNNPDKEEYKWGFHQQVFASNNHTLMDNSLTFLAAMALAEVNVDMYTELMAHNLKNLEKPFSKWYPDSAWGESMSYWNFAGPYTTRLLMAMDSAFGHSFDYEKIDCLLNVADFPIYMQSPEGAFIFNMSYPSTNHLVDPIIYSMGKFKNDIGTMAYSLKSIDLDEHSDAILALEYDPNLNYDVEIPLTKDKLFRNNDIVTMRSTHDGSQPLFAGMIVQGNNEAAETLSTMNLGTLCLNALGERWIVNPGKEVYWTHFTHKLPPTTVRWEYYRTRAEALSCIVVDPSVYGGQNIYANAGIDVFESDSVGAYAISDLTDGYRTNKDIMPTGYGYDTCVIDEDQAKSYKRGIMLADNRRTFVVQDEIVLTKPSEMYSFFSLYLPEGNIELLEDGKSAIIHKNSKKLYVSVDCDKDFTLGYTSAEPLSTSPVPPEDRPNSSNDDFKRLAIHFDSVESANIRVCFTPYLCDEELSGITCSKFVPMSEWTNQQEAKEIPSLEDIRINGVSLEGFDKNTRCYETKDEFSISELTPVYDNTRYSVKIKNDEKTGAINILVTDKSDSSNMNSYSLIVPSVSHPETTYTNSSFGGVLLPQEFYRIARGDNLSTMYFKDNAPKGCTKAVLTVYAEVVGETFDTTLKQISLNADTQLKYLSGSNTTVNKNTKATASLGAIGKSFVYGKNMQKLEYDITSLIPKNGGEFVFAMHPANTDEDYIILPSHRNSDYSLRPQIRYYTENPD